MTIKEFLSHVPNDELTNRLRLIDRSIMELQEHGFYAVCNLSEIEVIDGEITLASFKNKIERVDSGYNDKGRELDILELCAIGICAYNHFDTFYSNKEFISYLMDNIDMFLEHGNIPRMMQEYYIDVLGRAKVDYLYNYEQKNTYTEGNSRENAKKYSKSTAVGRAFSDREAAYANVLVLPALLTLVYLLLVVMYYVFIK